jgi:hypothetical protein
MRCLCSPGGATEHCTIVGRDAVLLCTAVAQWYSVTLHRTSPLTDTDMRRLTTRIRSEKCVVRRVRRCANVIECTYTHLDSIAHYTPSLYIACCS